MKPITVLLADDHTIVREGLRLLLDAAGDIEVVAEAQTGRQAVEMVRRLRPAVVIMDLAMPVLNGIEATRQILKTAPATRVLVLSAHSDDAYVEQVVAVGAAGYMLKQSSAHVLSRAVHEVQAGRKFFSPSLSRQPAVSASAPPAADGGHGKRQTGLSSREREVLQLIAEGSANKQVAAELGISVKTVEKHRQRLMGKLRIHDTAGLTRYAIGKGIIESWVQLTIV